MAVNVGQLIERFKDLDREKQVWNCHFDKLAEYILTRKQIFNESLIPGEFRHEHLFDNAAQMAVNQATSAIVGMMWNSGAKTAQLVPSKSLLRLAGGSEDLKEWADFITDQLTMYMNKSSAGFLTALEEVIRDSLVFGTAGIFVTEKEDTINPIRYVAWDVKTMFIDEDDDGLVDTIFRLREYTVRQAAQRYGEDALSTKTRELLSKGRFNDKIKILHIIQPRNNTGIGGTNQNFPTMSVHIEYEEKHLLRESGFAEMPVNVVRLIKLVGEKYGRSPGMAALPDVVELNAIWESLTIAMEKKLDPPMGVLGEDVLGGNGIIDTSPGAVNVFSVMGRLSGTNPIVPLQTVEEINSTIELIQHLNDNISSHFFIDKLLDFNNDVRMTATETGIRNRLRAQSLGSIFSRLETELFTPVIERSVNILFRKGLLGVVAGSEQDMMLQAQGVDPFILPDVVVQAIQSGIDLYEISYLSPAKRAAQSDELDGTMSVLNAVATVAQAFPGMLDSINEDETVKRLVRLTGASDEIIRSLEAIEDLREIRQQQIQQAQQMEQARQASEIGRNAAQAQAMMGAASG